MKRTITTKASQDSTRAGDATMMQRVCIALLALVLCIGLMPSFAWAADEEDAATDVDADSQEVVVEESDSDEEEAVDIAVLAYDEDIDDSAEDEAIEDDDVEGDEVDANVPMFLADNDDENGDDDENKNESENSNASANNGAVIASSSAVAYDDEKAKTLFDNLVKRFSKGGEDAAISNDTVYAAIGLDMLALGDDIDADAVLKNLNDVEKPTAGVLAKYIMALTAAGEDCTKIEIDGEERNLIDEMDELISVDDMDIFSAVWILSAYLYKPYVQGEKCEMSIDGLVEFILNSHDEDNLFGDSEYGYDTQTTAQAIYALSLYYADLTEGAERDDPDLSDSDKLRFEAMDAMEDAAKAIIELQNTDGGIGYSHEYPESSIDATANAAVALQLLGYDTTDPESLNRDDEATPIGYLVDEADEDLNGYTANESVSNEPMTASTVLMALSAVDSDTTLRDDGYTPSGSTYPTYDLNDWLGNTATTGTNNGTSATPSSGSGYTSPTSAGGNGSTLAKTGDDNTPIAIATGIVALCALAVALVAARRLRRLRVNQ